MRRALGAVLAVAHDAIPPAREADDPAAKGSCAPHDLVETPA